MRCQVPRWQGAGWQPPREDSLAAREADLGPAWVDGGDLRDQVLWGRRVLRSCHDRATLTDEPEAQASFLFTSVVLPARSVTLVAWTVMGELRVWVWGCALDKVPPLTCPSTHLSTPPHTHLSITRLDHFTSQLRPLPAAY